MNVHVRPSIAGVFGVAVIAIASGCSCVAEGTACPALVIAPSTLDLRLGGTATFAASESATWSIAEAGGGTIDAAGAYRAPLAIGTWHVVATAADGTTATATVRVGPRELGLLAGHPGGPGNVDGVGEEAKFGLMFGMTGDDKGTLYAIDWAILDAPWRRDVASLRAIDVETRAVSTLTTELPLLSGDLSWHLPMVVEGGALYYATLTSIHRVDLKTHAITLVTGDERLGGQVDAVVGADARFAEISGMISDGAGNMYVIEGGANKGAHRDHQPDHGILPNGRNGDDSPILRRVALATGAVTTIAGTPGTGKDAQRGFHDGSGAEVRFGSLEGIGVAYVHDQKGFYLVDGVNGAVRHYDPHTDQVTTTCNLPTPIADIHHVFDTDGRALALVAGVLYSFDVGACRMDDHSSGAPGVFTAAWTTGPQSTGRRFAYFTETSGQRIVRTSDNPAPEAFVGTRESAGEQDGTGAEARLAQPYRLIADRAGGLYVVDDWIHPRLRHVDAGGAVSTVASFALQEYIGGIALDAAGAYVYVSSHDAQQIRRINVRNPKDVVVVASRDKSPGAIDRPMGLALDDAAGVLYWVETQRGRVQRLALGGGSITTAIDGLDAPMWVEFDGRGHLLVANLTAIEEITIADKGRRVVAKGFARIAGLAYDPAGVVYVADRDNERVRGVVVATGELFAVAGVAGRAGVALGDLPARLNTPISVAVLPDGGIAIGDETEHVIVVARTPNRRDAAAAPLRSLR